MPAEPLTTFGAVAAQLVEHGYRPVPIVPGWKHPPMRGWTTFRVDDAAIAEYRDHGCGLLCGELIGVDIDVLHEGAAAELFKLAQTELGTGLARIGQAPKLLVAYRTTTPFRKKQTRAFIIDGHSAKVEVLARGQQFVSHALHPVTKKPYRWLNGDPLDLPFTDLPEVTEAAIEAFLGKAAVVLGRFGMPQKPTRANGKPSSLRPPPDDTPARRTYAESALAEEVRQVATAARGSRNDRLNTAALKLGQLVAAGWLNRGRVERALEDAACANGLANDDGIESARATIRSGLEAGLREPRDPPVQQKQRNGSPADKGKVKQHDGGGPSSPPATEDALALAFATAHADTLRYVAAWSKWLRWDGKRWACDDTLAVFDLVRRHCREARKALPADASETLRAILSRASTVTAVQRLAKSDRRLAATVDQWDRDPDLLNTPPPA